MSKELANIKNKALNNKQAIDDHSLLIERYKQEVQVIKDELKIDEPKIISLKKEFTKKKNEIENNQNLAIKDKFVKIKIAYVKYMISCAKLKRLGNALVFFDKDQAKYVEVVTIEKFDMASSRYRDVRLIEYREDKTIRKMIQDEAIEEINSTLASAQVTEILNFIKSYKKVFEPVVRKESKYYFNTYTPNGFLEVKVENVINIDNFISNIMPKKYPAINALFKNLAPVDIERKYLINWLSFILNTARKTRNAIALVGIQGTGKGVLQEQIIEHAIHRDNCYTAGNKDITSSFNGWIENKLFLFFNEIKGNFNESSTQADNIKPIITEYSISLNDKFRKQVSMDNYANCMFFSNHDEFLQIEGEDRRYSVIKTEHRTLTKVASEDFKMDMGTFVKTMEKERDSFLLEMKMLVQDKQSEVLALSILENEVKSKIKERTNTVREKIKGKLLNRDVDWFKETIDDLIYGSENEKGIIGKKRQVVSDEEGNESVIFPAVISKFTNSEHRKYLIDEVGQGLFTNESLKWFSELYEIENIDNNSKYGIFWNTIINKAEMFTLVSESGIKRTSIRLRILDRKKLPLDNILIDGIQHILEHSDSKVLTEIIPF